MDSRNVLAEDGEVVAIGNLGVALGADSATGLIGAQMIRPGRCYIPLLLWLLGFPDIFKILGGLSLDGDFRIHFYLCCCCCKDDALTMFRGQLWQAKVSLVRGQRQGGGWADGQQASLRA